MANIQEIAEFFQIKRWFAEPAEPAVDEKTETALLTAAARAFEAKKCGADFTEDKKNVS